MDSFAEIWQLVQQELKKQVTEVAYNVWLSPLEFVRFENDTVYLSISEFKKNIIADKIEYDVAYDGNYIFYVTTEGILKQYEIKSGKTEILTDKTVTPYTLKVTKEDITFESDKEKVTIKRKNCI